MSPGNYEIQILLQIYDSIFLGKLLFNSQSLSRMTRKHYDELQQVRLRMLKQIMKVLHTTPTAGVFLEFGLLPIEHLINQQKLMSLHHIFNLNENDPVLLVYNEQQKFINEPNWSNEINNIRKLYGINHTYSQIKCFSEIKWKELVQKSIKDYVHKDLLNIARIKTKTILIPQNLSMGSELNQQPKPTSYVYQQQLLDKLLRYVSPCWT